MKKLFTPGNDSLFTSVGLLVLRLWLGLTMLLHHGLDKLGKFHELSSSFPDLIGVGHTTSLCLAIFAEVFASVLLVAGFLTRFGALVLTINMSVAFFMAHKGVLDGGELAFMYLGGYVVLLFAGAGKVSLDKVVFK